MAIIQVSESLKPVFVGSYTAVADDETNDTHEFVFTQPVTNAIVQVRATAGTLNETGLDVDIASGKVSVKVTTLATGDIISVIAW